MRGYNAGHFVAKILDRRARYRRARSISDMTGFEMCIFCHAVTDIPVTRHIQDRLGYIEGMGQSCAKCCEGF